MPWQLQADFITKHIGKASGSNFWCEKHTHPNQTKKRNPSGCTAGRQCATDICTTEKTKPWQARRRFVRLSRGSGRLLFRCFCPVVESSGSVQHMRWWLSPAIGFAQNQRNAPREQAPFHPERKPPLLIFRISDLLLLLLFLFLLFLWCLSCCVLSLCIIRCTGPSIDNQSKNLLRSPG